MLDLFSRIHSLLEEVVAKRTQNPGSETLYELIYRKLRDAIRQKNIPEGCSLPATRHLASALGISRSTLIKAYEILRLEGYIDSKQGSGYTVRPLAPKSEKILIPRSDNHYPELSKYGQSFRKNIALINPTDDKNIAFRPGLPPLDLFPVNQWKNLSNLYWRHIRFSDLAYSPSYGIDLLRKNLASYLNLYRGIKCDYRQIVVVSGSLQSLYLLGNSFLNNGDRIAMENPTFPNVHSIFKGLGAKIVDVDIDEEGMKTQDLELNPGKIKIVHTTPSCHYPTGIRMSLERRLDLIKWAERQKAIIIENDYEHAIHNYYENIPSIFSLDDNERTVFLGTFNRILHPSIRIGYMVLPPYLMDTIDALLRHSHRFVSPSIQIVLNEFIEKNFLNRHIKRIVNASEERYEIFKTQFEREMGDHLQLRKSQCPSLHVLAQLPSSVNDKELVEKLIQKNIVTHRLSKCYITEESKPGLILGFASVINSVIKRKLIKMGTVFHEGV